MRTVFLSILISIFLPAFFCANAQAQKIMLIGGTLSTGFKFYSLDISSGNCSIAPLNPSPCDIPAQDGNPLSMAIYKDTLYFNTTGGAFYRTILGNSSACQRLDTGVYSDVLTVDKNGLLYWIDLSNNLIHCDPHLNITNSLGVLNYYPSGDLVFYNDSLFLASESGLINVNISHPDSSTVYVQTPNNSFFGLINIPTGCNQNTIFGFNVLNGNEKTSLVQIDMANQSVGNIYCTLPIAVLDAASITESGAFTGVSIDSILRPSCTGTENNTSIHIYASSASTDSFIYTLNSSISNSTGIFNGLVNGNYNISIKTKDGCMHDTTIHIDLSAKISVSILQQQDTCSFKDGSIFITQTTGLGPLIFSLGNSAFTKNASFTGLDSGSYRLRIRDTNYCTLDTTLRINYFSPSSPPSISFINDSTCNSSNGSIHIYFANPSDPFTISFNGKEYETSDSISFANLNAGPYIFSFKSSAGCVWKYADTLSNIALTSNLFPTKDSIACKGSPIVLDAGIANASYIWDDKSTQETRAVDSTGKYWVTLNIKGCIASDSITCVFVSAPIISLPHDTTLCNTDQLILNASFPQTDYTWQDGSTASTYLATNAGLYYVQATNKCGAVTDSVNVKYQNCTCAFYVPSAFTPNHDGVNDVFKPIPKCPDNYYSNYEFKIFSRWGQQVFASKNASVGWDGTFKNQFQPMGGYAWTFSYMNKLTGTIIREHGTVILIR